MNTSSDKLKKFHYRLLERGYKKETGREKLIINFAIPAEHKITEMVSEKQDKKNFFKRTEKVVKYEGDGDTNRCWRTWNGPPSIWKRDLVHWKSVKELRPPRQQHS